MPYSSPSTRFVPELAGLRGISVISVMIFHAGVPWLKGGSIGVDMFFVLSGFLITSLLIGEKRRTGVVAIGKFYARRALRLGPALLLFLSVFMAASYLFFPRSVFDDNAIDTGVALVYMTNWSRAFTIHQPHYIGHFWSLSIEEQFYLIWPALFLVVSRISRDWRIAFGFTITLCLVSWAIRAWLAYSGAGYGRFYDGLDSRADSLLTGCALAQILANIDIDVRREKIVNQIFRFATPFASTLLVILAVCMEQITNTSAYVGYAVVELCCAVVIFDMLGSRESVIRTVLRSRLLIFVGSISYGLYVWHFPIFVVLMEQRRGPYGVLLYGVLFAAIAAMVSFYFVEKPLLQLKKRKFASCGSGAPLSF